ncbi:hypothetical protein CANINC_002242 [Pichia inconspicua]|uniref:J domain-containing protein n=1 Tax=Pichia inconspicua TaxID=52247 RepID=A0A4T0X335_9ASCO|nr:hypothetical protein CANINC_002242 [[Candida] inconspicua]
MDRARRKDSEWLKANGKTAYDCLGVDKLASFELIKKAYRKNALLLHPDKNQDSSFDEMFRAVNVSYQILSDPESRRVYDEELERETSARSNVEVAKFKSDLRNREETFQTTKETEACKKLRIEQLSKWYDDYLKNENIISTSTVTGKPQHIFPRTVQLKWKNNPSVSFDEELISKLMSVFTVPKEVKLFKENGPKDRYHYATIEFESPVAAAILATHDFSTTQDHWDTMKLRKTASLLRDAKLIILHSLT